MAWEISFNSLSWASSSTSYFFMSSFLSNWSANNSVRPQNRSAYWIDVAWRMASSAFCSSVSADFAWERHYLFASVSEMSWSRPDKPSIIVFRSSKSPSAAIWE